MLMNYKQYGSLISQCIATKNLNFAKILHSHFIQTSLIFDTFVSNRLIELYSKCGSIATAQNVFNHLTVKNNRSWNVLVSGYCSNGLFDHAHQLLDEMPEPDIVSYNAVLSGLAKHGFYNESLRFFKRMQGLGFSGLFLDEYTIVNGLSSCAVFGLVKLLRQFHGVVVVLGLQFDGVVCNALIDCYGKCGCPDLGYNVFDRMVEKNVVSWTSMVAAFARASRMDDACRVFHQMPVKNTISWTTLISGFAQNEQGMEALRLFAQMQNDNVQPNTFTYVAALGACADLALIEKGKQFHCCIVRSNNTRSLLNLYTYNALIDMYCKCGEMRSARMLFDSMTEKDTVSWNSLVTGFAQNGHHRESLELFERMIAERVKPNNVTFLGVLSACCHTGLVDESTRLFELMGAYSLKPGLEHYSIMIDLLGRKNRLNDALDLIEGASGGSDHVGMWGALLAACRVHGNTVLAKKAADMLFILEPSNTARYVMLSNIYAADSKWDDYRQVRKLMGEKGLKKEAGFSWIEVKNTRHEFVAKDQSHCCCEDIYTVVHGLLDQMSETEHTFRIDIDLEDEWLEQKRRKLI